MYLNEASNDLHQKIVWKLKIVITSLACVLLEQTQNFSKFNAQIMDLEQC